MLACQGQNSQDEAVIQGKTQTLLVKEQTPGVDFTNRLKPVLGLKSNTK